MLEELMRLLRAAGYSPAPAWSVFSGRRARWPYVLLPRWGVAVTVGRRTSLERARDQALQLSGWIVVRALTPDMAVDMVRDEVAALRLRAPAG